jgi:peptidyl-prolyl cis-trans isomerase B (cyclophilin B)
MRKRFLVLCLTLLVAGLGGLSCKKQAPVEPESIKAEIEVQNRGTMVFVLDHKEAPNAVKQFTKLAKEGYYDGLLFWYISQLGLVQSGCAYNDGTGYATTVVKGEMDTTRLTKRGSLVMIHHFDNDPTLLSSQWLICKKSVPEIDGKHTIIGQLIGGDAVLDKIEKGDTVVSVTIKEIYPEQ